MTDSAQGASLPATTSAPRSKDEYRPGILSLRNVFLRDVPLTTRLRFVATIALTLVVSVFAALSPISFSEAVDALNLGEASKAIGFLIGAVAEWGLAKVLIETRWLVYQPAENRLLAAVREHYLTHILALPATFHANRSIGRLDTIVGQGIGGLRSLLCAVFTQLAPMIFEIIVAFAPVLSLELATIVGVTIGLYLALLVLGAERVSARLKGALDNSIFAQGKAGDAILNAEGIKIMALERTVAMRYATAIEAMHRRYVAFYHSRGVFGIVLGMVLIAGFGATLTLAFAGVIAESFSIGQFVLVNALLLQLFRSIEGFSFSHRDSRQALSSVSRFVGLLSEPRDVDVAGLPLPATIERIDIDRVSFEYPDGRTGLLPVSMRLEKGRITALLGPSGSGKSTLVRLLLKLYPVSKGQISIDGIPLREVAAVDVRSRTAVLPQEPVLFRDTLAFNVALSEDIEPERLYEAIAKARLDELLARLPEGIDAEIGERGVKVSGGERQRIGIARILYARPQILLLDEATSALDGATRDEILEVIKVVARDCVTLMITHDPKVAAISDVAVALGMQPGEPAREQDI